MQKCIECSNSFKYNDILKSLWFNGFGYEPIKCDKCNTTHHVHFSTRLILGCLLVSPVLFINFASLFFDYYFTLPDYSLVIYILWLIIIVLITPFYARYHIKGTGKNKEQVLLASNLKNTEAEIIVSILESYNIPFIKKPNGFGTIEILSGASLYGIDIYVQPHMYDIAKELINPDNIVEEDESEE